MVSRGAGPASLHYFTQTDHEKSQRQFSLKHQGFSVITLSNYPLIVDVSHSNKREPATFDAVTGATALPFWTIFDLLGSRNVKKGYRVRHAWHDKTHHSFNKVGNLLMEISLKMMHGL